MSVRTALRAATRPEHEAVDALFGRFDLSDSQGYRAFLAATRAAFAPVEQAIDQAGGEKALEDWPGRRRAALLAADCLDMGADDLPAVDAPVLNGPAETLGAIYVLEGSRLGGALLRRGVPASWPTRFLNASMEPGSWPKLIATLDTALTRPEDLRAAIAAAQAVFRCFETAATDQECVERV